MIPPLPNSYWALRGRLLAGEHPAGKDDAATRRRVDLLLAAGVGSFIDLTCAGEMPPYAALLPDTATYRNLPIPDHRVPQAPARMREIIRAVEQALAGEDAVYVHCRAGIGRTGMAIGCWLRERGNSPEEALQALNRLWRQNARSVRWPTIPETAAQEEYILGWQAEARDGVCT